MSSNSDDLFVLITINLIAIVGLLANGTSLHIIATYRNLWNPFGILCGGFAISHCLSLSILTLWMTFVIAIDGHWVESILAILTGQITNAMYYSAITILLVISANRFCAISLPTQYARIFTNRCATCSVTVIWVIYLLICSIYHIDGCSYIFDRDLYIWHFSDQQCGLLLSFYMDYLYGLIIVIGSVIIDALVLIRLLSYANVVNPSNSHLVGHTLSQRRRYEIKFFLQSSLYTAIFVIGLTLFHVVSQWQSTALQLFGCITVVWMTALSLCGFVFVGFNWKHLCCLSNSSIAITNVTEMGKTNTSMVKTTFIR